MHSPPLKLAGSRAMKIVLPSFTTSTTRSIGRSTGTSLYTSTTCATGSCHCQVCTSKTTAPAEPDAAAANGHASKDALEGHQQRIPRSKTAIAVGRNAALGHATPLAQVRAGTRASSTCSIILSMYTFLVYGFSIMRSTGTCSVAAAQHSQAWALQRLLRPHAAGRPVIQPRKHRFIRGGRRA